MKQWYESKTIWLGIVMILVGILPLIQPLMAAFLSPDNVAKVQAVTVFLGGFAAVVLRILFTDTTIDTGGNTTPIAPDTPIVANATGSQAQISQLTDAHIGEKTPTDPATPAG